MSEKVKSDLEFDETVVEQHTGRLKAEAPTLTSVARKNVKLSKKGTALVRQILAQECDSSDAAQAHPTLEHR